MKYIYLLLLILVLYYLFNNIYNKYSNQENFDPSLVPVSSIVTLAKVAQKLVDGGGTLTNPGNLQIGMPSAGAVGNLYVTGTNTVDGISTFNNPVTINGTTAFTGDNTLSGSSAISGNLSANTITSNQYNDSTNTPRIQLFSDGVNYYNSGSGNLHRFRGNGGNATGGNVLVDQDLTVSGNSNITGNSSIGGGLDVNGSLKVSGNVVIKNSNITAPADINLLAPGGSVNVNNAWGGEGNLNVSGKLSIGGTISNPTKTWRSTSAIGFGAQGGGTDTKEISPNPDTSGYKLFVITVIGDGWNNRGNRGWAGGTLSISYNGREITNVDGYHDTGRKSSTNSLLFYRKDNSIPFYMSLRHTQNDPIGCSGEWELTGIL